jgi:hypothetical protein
MKQLGEGYSVEVDQVSKDDWHRSLKEFADASFYQTWSFGAIHSGERTLSHVLLRCGDRLAAIAQTRLYAIPRTRWGMAYVSWGPLWRPRSENGNPDHLRNILRALYNEYVLRRGFFLTISPKVIESKATRPLTDIYIQEGFERRDDPQETVVLDLSPSLEQLSHNVGRSWRNSYKKALRQEVQYVEGNDADVAAEVFCVASEMKSRKNFFGGNQKELILTNEDLPPDLKLHMIVCRQSGEAVAALGWPTLGTTGIPLVGGTGNKGMTINASSLLWWKMIEYFKAHGFLWLDTGGVSERRNPGGYFFKTQLLGKAFVRPDRYLGLFSACKSPVSRLLFKVLSGTKELAIALGRQRATSRRKLARSAPPANSGD